MHLDESGSAVKIVMSMIASLQYRATSRWRSPRILVLSMALAFALILSSTAAWAITPGEQRWSMPFDGGYNVNIEAIAISDDLVVALGYVQGYTYGTRDRRVIAYDAGTGGVVWQDTFDASGDMDNAEDVVMGPSGGRVFVTGESYVSRKRGWDIVTAAFDADTGVRLWTRRYDGPHGEFDEARGIDISADGQRLFVTGTSNYDYLTIAYRTLDGAELWTQRFDDGVKDDAKDVAVSPSGNQVIVTGTSGPGIGTDYATVAYRADNGTELWRRWFGSAEHGDQAAALAVGPSGSRVYITGQSSGAGSAQDIATVAYRSTTGETSWKVRYDGPAGLKDQGRGIAVGSDGSSVFITGTSEHATGQFDKVTFAYASDTGAVIWSAREDSNSGFTLAVTPDGATVAVPGGSTVAYDTTTGVQRWSAADVTMFVAADPDGTQVVTASEDTVFAYAT
jgi:hypothetical protein